MKKKINFILQFSFSLLLVALGQPARIGLFGAAAAVVGFAWFWYLIKDYRRRFWLSVLWFSIISAVQLSWMSEVAYKGSLIMIVYGALCVLWGVQFGWLSILIFRDKALGPLRILAIAALWVLPEWARLFIMSGFSWNPVGLALSWHYLPAQMAALFGVYGLSFWVMLTNLWGYRFFCQKKKAHLNIYIFLALFPYIFGIGFVQYRNLESSPIKESLVWLVQTGLLPHEVYPLGEEGFVPLLEQWQRIFALLPREGKPDLIVLPEGSVALGAKRPLYPMEFAISLCRAYLGPLPEIEQIEPFVYRNEEGNLFVSNAFFARMIADFYDAEVVAGFEGRTGQKAYNAAFYFQPHENRVRHYKKQILVPIGEYIPFAWLKDIAATFGIYDSYVAGKKMKVFHGRHPLAVSICYEETFGNLMSKSARLGAQLLVNISNDGWYPKTALGRQHFEHGRLRAIENGMPLVRACSIGVTAAVDAFGRTIDRLESENRPGLLAVSVPKRVFSTPYSRWGDYCIVGFCLLFIAMYLSRNLRSCPK